MRKGVDLQGDQSAPPVVWSFLAGERPVLEPVIQPQQWSGAWLRAALRQLNSPAIVRLSSLIETGLINTSAQPAFVHRSRVAG